MLLKSIKYFLLFLVFVSFTSCATTKVEEFYNNLAPLIEERDISGAVSYVSDFYNSADKYNKLLYSLELGYLYHIDKNYKDSNTVFENAKSLYSLQDYTSKIFNNGTLLPKYYQGEDFEMAYTNVFCALNYIKLRKKNESAVEARQVNNLFNKIKLTKEKSVYKDDPFVRYFMGIIYENAGYLNDAMVSYKIALRAYNSYNIAKISVSQDLLNRLYTLYRYYSLDEEAVKLRIKYPKTEQIKFSEGGTLVIVNYNGIAPKKVEQVVQLPFDNAWRKYYNINNDYRHKVSGEFGLTYISAAFPKYERYDNKIKYFTAEVTNTENPAKKYSATSYLASDIGTIMEKTLEQNYKMTFFSRINSYVVGMKEIEEVRRSYEEKRKDIYNQDMLKETKRKLLDDLRKETLTRISDIKARVENLNSVDLKSWRSVPETINMANLILEPGKYKGLIKYFDSYGKVVTTKEIKFKIRRGRNRFVITLS